MRSRDALGPRPRCVLQVSRQGQRKKPVDTQSAYPRLWTDLLRKSRRKPPGCPQFSVNVCNGVDNMGWFSPLPPQTPREYPPNFFNKPQDLSKPVDNVRLGARPRFDNATGGAAANQPDEARSRSPIWTCARGRRRRASENTCAAQPSARARVTREPPAAGKV